MIPTQKLLDKWRINKEKDTLTVATEHLTGGGVNKGTINCSLIQHAA